MAGEHAYVDETKSGGLVVVAVMTGSARIDASRAVVRGLLAPNQTHLHFTKERTDRKKMILRAILQLEVQVDVYDATGCDARKARDRAMDMIVEDLAAARAAWLHIEQDDSLVEAERKVLARSVNIGAIDSRSFLSSDARRRGTTPTGRSPTAPGAASWQPSARTRGSSRLDRRCRRPGPGGQLEQRRPRGVRPERYAHVGSIP